MSYQVLARKWRPQSFQDMVGQSHVLTVLKNALDSDRLHHAYLFTGTRGVGKTTLARILAKCLNCEKGVTSEPCNSCSACVSINEGRFVDLIEVDAASRAKVEETRELMDNVQYAPSSGRFKVYLIDEVHMFSNHSFNALLKTLEEPPPHVKFLLATTEPKKLPITILSRCLQFNLKHLTRNQISEQLQKILKEEKIPTDDVSLRLIASSADGSMRDALSLLDQTIAFGSGELRESQVREMLGTIDSENIALLLEALATADPEKLFQAINTMDEHNPDYDAVMAELLSDLHDIAVIQAIGSQIDILKPELVEFAERFDKEDVQLYYQIALNGRRDLHISPEPKTGFEMTMIRMLAFKPGGSVEPVNRKIEAGTGHEPTSLKQNAKQVSTTQGAREQPGDWQQIIDEMALAGLVKEMAGHCVLKKRTKDKVHLVLMPAQEHLIKTTQKDRLQNAIAERFGADVKLIITIEESADETPSQKNKREAKSRQEKATSSFVDDPVVKEIVDIFDADIENESIQPQ